MSDLLANLNPEQLAAVTLPSESALVLAGAGSGKTRVLTTRIAWLISTGQVSPGGVLAVTFTNKAAKEMLTRLSSLLPLPLRGMWIGTFHGLCNRFLRAHWRAAALPQTFQILDAQDQLSAVKRLLKAIGVDEQRAPPKQVMWFINGCKEEGMRARDCPQRDAQSRLMAEIYAAYEGQCQREGVVDFAELLLRTYEVLRDHADIRAHYRARFRHVLIDEFQDTNRLQYRWIKLLAGPGEPGGAAVMAVGDDDQSIYAFRGANVGNMDDFRRDFSVRHLIKLERNYRSHANILDAANHLISHNARRLGKTLRTEAGSGEPVRVVEHPTDQAEALWVVDEIRQLVGDARRGGAGEGVARDQIALLYRSNAQSRVIEGALFNAGIPYKVYGGLRFFERAEVKHALAYLRLLHSPRDDNSFLRVVNFPARGIGARSLEQLQDAARERGVALCDAVPALAGRAAAALQDFLDLLSKARADCAASTMPELVRHVLDVSGLLDHYRTERDGQDRVENLEELVNAAAAFAAQEGFGLESAALEPQPLSLHEGDGAAVASPLEAFLTHASLEAGDNQAQPGQDAVQLMTVHAAKGLEFDVVFITGLEEGLFPHENSLDQADGIEEERRLMYVAITRARRRLYLSYAQSRLLHGQTRYNLRSRFFDELPESALKWLAPPRPAGGGYGARPGGGGYGGGGYGTDRGGSQAAARPAWSSAWDDTGSRGRGGSTGDHGRFGRAEWDSSVPFEPAPKDDGAEAWRVGQRVFHTKFGEGTIIALDGMGQDARAQVRFKRHGEKWLALAVAKLTLVA